MKVFSLSLGVCVLAAAAMAQETRASLSGPVQTGRQYQRL
jgi:hypothetical protein